MWFGTNLVTHVAMALFSALERQLRRVAASGAGPNRNTTDINKAINRWALDVDSRVRILDWGRYGAAGSCHSTGDQVLEEAADQGESARR